MKKVQIKYPLARRHIAAIAVSALLYVAYLVTWVALETAGLDRDKSGGAAHYWAYALCTVAYAVMLFLMFVPDFKPISRNITPSTADRIVNLRRNTISVCMSAVIAGCFGMSMAWMNGLRQALVIKGELDYYTQIGIMEMFGMIMMFVVAMVCAVYFVKARETFLRDMKEQAQSDVVSPGADNK